MCDKCMHLLTRVQISKCPHYSYDTCDVYEHIRVMNV